MLLFFLSLCPNTIKIFLLKKKDVARSWLRNVRFIYYPAGRFGWQSLLSHTTDRSVWSIDPESFYYKNGSLDDCSSGYFYSFIFHDTWLHHSSFLLWSLKNFYIFKKYINLSILMDSSEKVSTTPYFFFVSIKLKKLKECWFHAIVNKRLWFCGISIIFFRGFRKE